jgi:cold shock CspA family protein
MTTLVAFLAGVIAGVTGLAALACTSLPGSAHFGHRAAVNVSGNGGLTAPALYLQPERENAMTEKQLGIVKRYFIDKGFGFLRPAEVGFNGRLVPTQEKDYFVHVKALNAIGRKLVPGDHVRFNVHTHRGRTEACDVELVAT